MIPCSVLVRKDQEQLPPYGPIGSRGYRDRSVPESLGTLRAWPASLVAGHITMGPVARFPFAQQYWILATELRMLLRKRAFTSDNTRFCHAQDTIL